MARHSLQVQVVLDRLHCHDEGDGIGSAEPYLWTVFFKIDGDTVALGDDGFLHGTATVVPTPGSHGNLGDTDVDEDDDVLIPSAIGEFLTTLRPIPVPDWFPVDDTGGVAGLVAVLMEEDWVSDAGAEAGHAALNVFVQQTLDGLIPTLGVSNPSVSEEEIAQLSAGAVGAVAQAVEDAQGGWDNFASWLNGDDQIGSKVWTFGHDTLADAVFIDLVQRWKNEGDWELFGHLTAVPTCPVDASVTLLQSFGLVTEQEARSGLEAAREFRRTSFAGRRGPGAWWQLAESNTAAIADVLRRDPEVAGRAAARIALEVPNAARSGQPLPGEVLEAMADLCESCVANGSRRLRIAAKAGLGVLPTLSGLTVEQAVRRLGAQPPSRKPKRLPRLRRARIDAKAEAGTTG